MKKFIERIVLLSLFSLAAAATAAGTAPSGTMQVSFVVQEACVVLSASERPAVSCEHDSPYSVQHAGQQAADPARSDDRQQAATSAAQPATAQEWTVYF
jgi:hypothetical protein